MQKYNPEGLRACLKEFNESGKTASCGNWKIARGGYDLNWELYYGNKAVIRCVGRQIHAVSSENENSNIGEIVKAVLGEYKDLKRTFTVDCTLVYNGTVTVDAIDEEEARNKVENMLCHENGDEFPDGGVFGGVRFSFGEATADEAYEE